MLMWYLHDFTRPASRICWTCGFSPFLCAAVWKMWLFFIQLFWNGFKPLAVNYVWTTSAMSGFRPSVPWNPWFVFFILEPFQKARRLYWSHCTYIQYHLVIQHSHGKSLINGGINGKIIYKWAIFHGYVALNNQMSLKIMEIHGNLAVPQGQNLNSKALAIHPGSSPTASV